MNQLASELASLNILGINRLLPFYPRVRDRSDISVLRDSLTEVIVLSSSSHISVQHYREKEEIAGRILLEGEVIKSPSLSDDYRRQRDFGSLLHGKRWLDFGCGLGGILNLMKGRVAQSWGLEPSQERARIASSKGLAIFRDLDQIPYHSLDVISMFHVLEHLNTPLQVLKDLRARLQAGGIMLIEVPHARDALFTLYDCEAFKQFTFWSEHLVLHTRQSLRVLLEHAGFTQIEISGKQRYPLSNHLHWLAQHKPGGHDTWGLLNSAGLHSEYEAALARIDRTDTLIATARVPEPG